MPYPYNILRFRKAHDGNAHLGFFLPCLLYEDSFKENLSHCREARLDSSQRRRKPQKNICQRLGS